MVCRKTLLPRSTLTKSSAETIWLWSFTIKARHNISPFQDSWTVLYFIGIHQLRFMTSRSAQQKGTVEIHSRPKDDCLLSGVDSLQMASRVCRAASAFRDQRVSRVTSSVLPIENTEFRFASVGHGFIITAGSPVKLRCPSSRQTGPNGGRTHTHARAG